MGKTKSKGIRVSQKTKLVLLDLVKSWDGISARLQAFAQKQAAEKDYPTAAENHLLSEGIAYCADELRKLLPQE